MVEQKTADPEQKTAGPENYPAGACIPAHLIKSTESQIQYAVSPQPFKVALDSPTDFVAVLVVPIALAIAAGIFTIISNREQMKASTANFRHTWQLDLRNAMVSYLGAVQQMLVRAKSNDRFPISLEAESIRTQMFAAQNTIILMLDTEKQYAKELKAQMLAVTNAIYDFPGRIDDALNALDNVMSLSQTALERAWQDIRRDLRVVAKKSDV